MGIKNAELGSDEQDVVQFQEAIQGFEDLLWQKEQVARKSCSDRVWLDFLALPYDQRTDAIEKITFYTAILEEASKANISLLNDKRLSWFAMKMLNLVPPAGLLELVGDTDYTEIYNADGIQIFRNLEFYTLFSYTIADVTLNTWEQLYHRKPEIKTQIKEQGFIKGFSGEKEPFKLNIELHEISEALSEEKRHYHVSFGYLAPLRNRSNKVEAVFATSKITTLDGKRFKKGA